MKLYSHAVLMTALALPAFCQSPVVSEVQAAREAQAAGRAEAAQFAREQAARESLQDLQRTAQDSAREVQAAARVDFSAAMAAQADAMAIAREKMSTLDFDSLRFSGDLADAFSADKMAGLNDKLAQLKDKFDAADFFDIQSKAATAADKLKTFDLDSKLGDLQLKLKSLDFDKMNFADIQSKAEAAADKMKSLDFDSKLGELQMKLDGKDFKIDTKAFGDLEKVQEKLGELKFKLDTGGFGKGFGQSFGDMAFLQAPRPLEPPVGPAPPVPPAAAMARAGRVISIGRGGDGEYDQGTRALDQHHYEEAALRFDAVINSKSTRIDGALYWKAYALNRAGKRDEALAALTQLRRDFPQSGYLNDAQALEAEVKQNNGQPVSPAQESNEDLKLLAINSLMNADAERAIPLIEGILKANGSLGVKDRALFVLAQSRSARAQQVLSDYAKGSGNPDLQLRAIQYVSMSRSKESMQLLAGIYSSSSDARVKNQVLQQLMNARAYDSLLSIAKTEKDASLRNMAIRNLASDRSAPADQLIELYGSSDVSAKRAIVDGFSGRHDAKTMIDLARRESDPKMKAYVAERIGSMHDNKDAMDYMIELIKQ